MTKTKMRKTKWRKSIAYILIACIIGVNLPAPTLINAEEKENEKMQIVDIQHFLEDISKQNVDFGTSLDNLKLPSEIEVTINKDLEEKEIYQIEEINESKFEEVIDPTFQVDQEKYELMNITDITWESTPNYDGNIADIYTFTPNFPEQYEVVEGVVLPEIEITVLEEIVEPEIPEGSDILLDTLKNTDGGPYFKGNTLYGNNNIIILTEVEGSIKAFWDKNLSKVFDEGDVVIDFDENTSLNSEDWNINGGKEDSTLDTGCQIIILAGQFNSIDGGEGDNKRLLYIGVDQREVTVLDNFDQISYKITIDSKNGDETYKVWQPYGENMVEITRELPIKEASRFLGYYDKEIGGKQYYNDQIKVANDGNGNAVKYDKKSTGTLYAQWAEEKGIFAGRFSSYQVFDCKRATINLDGKSMFKVSGFALPFDDSSGNGTQMKKEDVAGKIFSIRKSGEEGKPFIVYMADDTSGTNAKAISGNGTISNLGDEGLLFVSLGSDKGYFFSLSQGFEYGGELTYLPNFSGNIGIDKAEDAEASPSPWFPDFSCAVVFDSQGAQTIALPSQISVKRPTTADVKLESLPSEPVKNGYTFGGWFTEEYGKGTKITEDTMLSKESITAYAYWIPLEGFAVDITLKMEKDNGEFGEFGLGQASINNAWEGNIDVVSGYKVDKIVSVRVDDVDIPTNKYKYDAETKKMTIDEGSVTGNIVITAKLEPIKYTIKYNPNGANGDANPSTQLVTFGEEVFFAELGTMELEGKTFKGWADRKVSNVQYAPNGRIVDALAKDNKEMTLYAVWEENSFYTVKYDTDGGSSISDKVDVKWSDSNLKPTNIPTKEGYIFDKWQFNEKDVTLADSYGSLAKDYNVLEITFKAVWKEKASYTVKYDTDGGSSISDKVNVKWTDANLLPNTNPKKNRYSFEGWYYGDIEVSNDTTISTLIPLDDKDFVLLKARWKANPEDSLGVSGKVEDETGTEIEGASVTLKQGNNIIYGPITTNIKGEYMLSDVKPGIYNLVASKGNQTVTIIINMSDSDVEKVLRLPSKEKNSILDITGADTPSLVVGNLDEIANKSELGSGNTSLTVKLSVEKIREDKDSKQTEIIAIRKDAGEKANILFLDAILTKQIDNNQPVDIGNSNDTVLEIVVPYDFTNKTDVKVYRYHDEVNVFRQLQAKPQGTLEGQTYYLDKTAGRIHIYAKKYSVYAIAYSDITEDSKPDTGENGNGGNSSSKPNKKPSEKLPTETGASNWFNVESHNGYIVGNSDGLLHPEDNITRGEVAAIFYNLLRSEIRSKYETTVNPFTDVSSNDWYNNAISTLFNAGIVKGMPDGNFAPNQYITRGEFAAIAAQFASEVYNGENLFTDISEHWAKIPINRAASYGWVNGVGDGRFLPDRSITRAEAIALVNKVLGRVPKNLDSLLSEMKTWPDNKDTSKWYYTVLQEATNGHTFVRTEDKVTENWTKLIN